MPLAWNEIRHRAIKFSNEWEGAKSEAADKQTFWNEFFDVFGAASKTVASFEAPVKKVSGHDGAIDLFWKGTLIVEHKSLGGHLGKAQSQVFYSQRSRRALTARTIRRNCDPFLCLANSHSRIRITHQPRARSFRATNLSLLTFAVNFLFQN